MEKGYSNVKKWLSTPTLHDINIEELMEIINATTN